MKQTCASILLILCMAQIAQATPCPDPNCNEPVSKAIQKIAKNEEENFVSMSTATVAEDKSQLEDCLSGIDEFGIGLTFNIPSLDNLFNEACETLQGVANERINAIKGKFTYADMSGIVSTGATSGENSAKVKVSDISKSTLQRLSKSLEGIIK